jgi:GDSL-like Lipase/Acylhydrolase family
MVNRSAIVAGPTSLLLFVVAILAPFGAGAEALTTSPTPVYLALGDSYSSGEGLGPFLANSGNCDRSLKAYPELVTRRLGRISLRFLACSGANIAHIRDQISSISFNDLRHVDLTTVTAGGNDLPFSRLIAACTGAVTSTTSLTIEYLPSVSSSTLCANAISGAASLLGAGINPVTGGVTIPMAALSFPLSHPSTIESRLTALFMSVLHAEGAVKHRDAAPRLLVVQYPTLLGSPGLGACLLSPTPLPLLGATTTVGSTGPFYPAFTSASSYALGELNSYLQLETSVVVEILRSEGYLEVSLVPPESSFTPLNCTTGTSPDINGLLLTEGAPIIGSGSFHPTAVGQSALAASVVATWRTATRHH